MDFTGSALQRSNQTIANDGVNAGRHRKTPLIGERILNPERTYSNQGYTDDGAKGPNWGGASDVAGRADAAFNGDTAEESALRAAATRNMRGEGAPSAGDLGTLYNDGVQQRGNDAMYSAAFRRGASNSGFARGGVNDIRDQTSKTIAHNDQRGLYDSAAARQAQENTGANLLGSYANMRQGRFMQRDADREHGDRIRAQRDANNLWG